MQLPFWSSLTERERETVQRSAVTRRYEKGALIHDGGSECLGLVLVLSGELRTYLLSDEGREVTCACCRPPASSARSPLTPR